MEFVFFGLLTCVALLTIVPNAMAQDTKKAGGKEGESKSLFAVDGWPLKLTYYKSTEGKEAAVVVLLHPKGESRLAWTAPGGFAEQLNSKGFAVIALDFRKHGQSKPGADDDDTKKASSSDKDKKKSSANELKSGDYLGMVADLEAVKKFIFEEHQKGTLNMRKTSIVAPEMSAAVSLVFAVNDWNKKPYDDSATASGRTPRGQDIQALVLISPETNVPGLQAHQVVPTLKATPLAALIVVGKTDSHDKDQAKKLFQQLGGDSSKLAAPKKTEAKKGKEKEAEAKKDESQRLYYVDPPTKLRGTDLFGKKLGVEEVMLGFLTKHVQELKGPVYEWRDRQSRLTE